MFGFGLGTKILGGALIVSLLASGFFYVQKIRAERQADEQRQLREVAEAALKVAEKTIKIFREWENVDEVIKNTTDDDVLDYLRTGVWPKGGDKAGNRPAAVPGPAKTGEPDEGQKR